MSISPTAEGFRAAFRRPSLTLAEIAWRWAVGITATTLFFFGLIEYLNTLPVTNRELLFLRSRQPYLVGQAIAHILRGSLSRAVISAMVAALMLTLLWIIAAAVGRLATVRALLEYFRRDVASYVSAGASTGDGGRDVASNVSTSDVAENGAFPTLVRLNFLRAAVALAAVCGFLGAAVLSGFASPDTHPRPGLAFLIFLPLAGLVYLAWSSLNWLLSLCGIFAVRDGGDAVGAIFAAASFSRERAGPIAAVSTWTGLGHMVVFVIATTVVSMPLGLAPLVPWRLVVAAMIVVTSAYCAVADWLYMARLAGYVCITEIPEALFAPTPPSPQPVPPDRMQVAPAMTLQTTIDRDEPILSDVPSLALET